MRAWKIIFVVTLVTAMEFVSSSALAQTSRETQNRIQRLENEIQTLSRAVYRGEAPPSPIGSAPSAQNNAAVELRLQGLENQIRNLTGTIERQSYETQQLQQAFDRYQADMNIRLQDLERGTPSHVGGFGEVTNELPRANNPPPSMPQRGMQYISPSNSDAAPQPLTGDELLNAPVGRASTQPASLGQLRVNNDGVASNVDTPTSVYERAFADLRGGDHKKAEDGFDAFLQQYPDHSLAGNAAYWRAETYYVRGDFEGSARLFAQAYQQFPQGQKAPDNLLKLGLSLAGQGNNGDACIALDQLTKNYGDNQTPVLQRASQEMSRLGC